MSDKQLDLLIVNPGGRKGVYQGLHDADLTSIETPVWCGLLASYVRKHGFTAEIVDVNAEQYGWLAMTSKVALKQPKLVAVVCYGQQPSASTQTMPAAYECVKAIKKAAQDGGFEQPVIMVGGHVAALPQRTLEESGADYVATGEGCETVVEILRGKSIVNGDVRGIGFFRKFDVTNVSTPSGKIETLNAYAETHAAPNVADVNDMQVPWDDLPPERYRAHNWQCLGGWPRTPYAALYTSLGCPHACRFCMIQAPFREGDRQLLAQKKGLTVLGQEDEAPNSYRLWNPDSIGQQIADLYYKHGCRTFKVADEMFVLNRRHVEGVCDAILRRIAVPGGPNGINIWAYARVDTANDEKLLARMRASGFRWLCLGIECASESVREGIDKGYAQEKIARCCERIKAAGIHVLANYIVGLPGDTLESMQQTLDLALELCTPWMNVYCFPAGTDVWTPDGFRKIEELRIGDAVYGKNGVTTVTNVGNRVANDVVEVKPRHLPAIRCTSEHPFWVAVLKRKNGRRTGGGKRLKGGIEVQRYEWVNAGDLQTFDKDDLSKEYHALVVDKRNFRREQTELDLSGYVVGHVGENRVGGQLNEIGKKYLKPWPVTEDMAELFGWYVAEGSIMSRKNKQVGFSLHKDETEHHARIQELIARCLGLKSRILPVGPNCVQITFTSKVWLRAVHDIFGEDARTKKIPECVMNASDAVVRAFLKGYCNGDGTSWANKNGQMSCSTASSVLGKQLMMLFLKTGVVPTYSISKPGVKTWARDDGRFYDSVTNPQTKLCWQEKPEDNGKNYLETDEAFLVPVRSVEQCYGEETVYNIETRDHTFAIPEVVHNCSMPYPGSPMWDDYPEHHALPWQAFSQHSYETHPTKTATLTSAQVLEFRDRFWLTYFTNTKVLSMLESTFGRSAVEEVTRMTSYKLRRKLLETPHEPCGST